MIKKLLPILMVVMLLSGCGAEESTTGTVKSSDQTFISTMITTFHETNTIDSSKVRQQREEELAEKQEGMSELEKEALADFLAEQGIDEDLANSVTELDNGAKMIGDAMKVVKQFPTLHDGETYYGTYLGFHNKIKCLDGYDLVGLYLIGDEYLQGVYETEDESKALTVKLSTTVNSAELRKPFNELEYKSSITINKYITVNFEGTAEDKIHLMTVDFKNNKAYAIFTGSGFSQEQFNEIAQELVSNVISMEDYYTN